MLGVQIFVGHSGQLCRIEIGEETMANKWDLKTVRRDWKNRVFFHSFKDLPESQTGKYERAMEIAAASQVANPKFSNYFCKESAVIHNGNGVSAGNIEYGLCQALHGEESAVSAFRSVYGRGKKKPLVLAIISSDDPRDLAAPCGNCRDIMLDDFGPDFEIVSGRAEGGLAVVAKMSDYLFDKPRIDSGFMFPAIRDWALETLSVGQSMENDPYSPRNLYPERRYYVSLATKENKYFGAHHLMCDYHPVYAMERAILKAMDIKKDPFVACVMVVASHAGPKPLLPHVMYRDRQHLYELNLYKDLIVDHELDRLDPSIYLCSVNQERKVDCLWRTTVKEWLPFPFSPMNFGREFLQHLKNYQEVKR